MAISSYAELQTAVRNWLNRTDLNAYITDFIRLGEDRIYRELRLRTMETALSETIASGIIAVPSDYVELKFARIDAARSEPLFRTTPEQIYDRYPIRSSEGRPKYIARESGNFIFGPYPDSAYSIKGVYYKRLTALSDSNTTNWFTANASGVLLWSALAEAAPFIGDDARTAIWEAKFQAEKQRIQEEDRHESKSGGPLSAKVSWR